MTQNDEITIVIVSYKSKNKISNFLKGLKINFRVIIIENSDDLSIKHEISKISKNIEIYFTGNIGYGSSANFARKKINTKYFFLFNPDLTGVDNFMIKYFLDYAKKVNDNFSCLGPRYENISEKTLKQSNIKHEMGFINAISGAAMFFNAKNFDSIGGFDENIFLYFDETDYCKRGKKLNLYSYQLNMIKISHDVGTAVEFTSQKEKKEIQKLYTWHFIWSKYYFYNKHYGAIISLIFFFPIIIRSIFKILIFKIFNNNEKLEKYQTRLNGLLNSILGKKSYKRIDQI